MSPALFLETAKDSGTLEELLTECGYEFDGADWRSPHWISIERLSEEIGARQ